MEGPGTGRETKGEAEGEKGKGGILKGIGGGGAGRTNRRGRGVSGAGHESVIIGQGGKEKWKEEKVHCLWFQSKSRTDGKKMPHCQGNRQRGN